MDQVLTAFYRGLDNPPLEEVMPAAFVQERRDIDWVFRFLEKQGDVRTQAGNLAQVLGVTENEAQETLDQLELADFAVMAKSAAQAGKLDLSSGPTGAVKRFFSLTFGDAKKVVRELETAK